jgi:hypothetical protein
MKKLLVSAVLLLVAGLAWAVLSVPQEDNLEPILSDDDEEEFARIVYANYRNYYCWRSI